MVKTKPQLGLVCPKCMHSIVVSSPKFVCEQCNNHYDVTDGIPDFLLKEQNQSSAHEASVLEENIKLHVSEARYYEVQHYVSFTVSEQRRLRRLVESFSRKLPDGEFALDLAAGTGNLTRHLLAFRFLAVSADLSFEMLSYQPFRNPKIRCHAQQLPFADKTFGLICGYSMLHHLPDAKAAVEEFARVAKPQSIIFLDHDPFAEHRRRLKRGLGAFLSFLLWAWNKPRYYFQTINYACFGRRKHRKLAREINFDLTDRNPFDTKELMSILEQRGFVVHLTEYPGGCCLVASRGFESEDLQS